MSTTSQFKVSGMTCDHCVRAVSGAFNSLPGVETVGVDLSTGVVDVRSAQPLDHAAVNEAVEDAGYTIEG